MIWSAVPRSSLLPRAWASLLLLATLLSAACAGVPALGTAVRDPIRAPTFRFAEETFAFQNDSRSLNPDKEDLYANYCFVMTRGVVQFFKFARFEPQRPVVSPQDYADLVRQVTSRSPWQDPLPPDERVVIPGYRNLHEFSRAEEAAVKAGLNARFWTLVHWTLWRVTFPVGGGHQEQVAAEVIADLRAGTPVQLLVTNFPTPELNHGVVAYDYRVVGGAVEFIVYDPNDPGRPGVISFQREPRRFWATDLHTVRPGAIRAFRMYYSPLL